VVHDPDQADPDQHDRARVDPDPEGEGLHVQQQPVVEGQRNLRLEVAQPAEDVGHRHQVEAEEQLLREEAAGVEDRRPHPAEDVEQLQAVVEDPVLPEVEVGDAEHPVDVQVDAEYPVESAAEHHVDEAEEFRFEEGQREYKLPFILFFLLFFFVC